MSDEAKPVEGQPPAEQPSSEPMAAKSKPKRRRKAGAAAGFRPAEDKADVAAAPEVAAVPPVPEALRSEPVERQPSPSSLLPGRRSSHGPRAAAVIGAVVGIALVLGAGYATLPLWSSWLQAPTADERAALVDLQARLDALETSVRRPPPAVAVQDLESRRAEVSAPIRDLMTRLDRLDERVRSLGRMAEAATISQEPLAEEEAERLQGLATSNDRLTSAVASLAQKVGTLEKAQTQAAADRDRRRLIESPDKLRESLRGAGSFSEELTALRPISADNTDLGRLLTELEPFAAAGIPTLIALQRRFDETATRVLQAAGSPEGNDLIGKAVNRLKALVTIRRLGAGTDGDDLDSRLAGAEAELEGGNLIGAVGRLDGLTGPAAAAAGPWIAEARARLLAEKAMAALHVRSIALLSAGGD